jgi:predicted kinase
VLTVVTGPPCAGKTTHVREHATPDDLVLDLDAIAHSMGYPRTQVRWGDEHPAVQAARMARAHVLYALLNHRLTAEAWVIDTDPDGSMRAQYQRAGARTVTIDPGQDVCLERAEQRDESTREGIVRWYARHGATRRAEALDIFAR